MRTLFRLLILSSVLLVLSSADHPMHLASHELRVGPKRIDWTLRIFTDDLEDAINAHNKSGKVRLESAEGRAMAEGYLIETLKVNRGKRPVPLRFDQYRYQPSTVEFKFHVDGGLPLVVSDQILHEFFQDQQNVYFVRSPKGRLNAVSTAANPIIELR
jgi:hypothetical protein